MNSNFQIYVVIACTPIGVASLLASTILKSCSIISLLKALALYVVTVLGGFVIHSTILLPITLIVLSQNNPFKVLRYAFTRIVNFKQHIFIY